MVIPILIQLIVLVLLDNSITQIVAKMSTHYIIKKYVISIQNFTKFTLCFKGSIKLSLG